MYRLLFFLTVYTYGTPAFPIENEPEDHDDMATVSTGGKDQCNRDLLIVLDLSFRIPKNSFADDVKPFLKKIIKSPILKVDLDGTRVGLIRFDKVPNLLFNVGNKTVPEMDQVIDGLQFDKYTGRQRRTDLALKMANEKVFQLQNPENRPDIGDAMILITDGEPREQNKTHQKTMEQAQILKDKKVNITILVVGKNRFDFLPYMKKLATSPEHVFDAKFINETDVEEILGKLVNRSCGVRRHRGKNGRCSCAGMLRKTQTIKSEKSKAKVPLITPPTRCEEGAKIDEDKTEVNPPPSHQFSAGIHFVNYTFSVQGVKLICPVKVNVKVKCGDDSYLPEKKACCHDKLYRRQDGYECCGKNYYKKSEMICCGNGRRGDRC